MQTLRRLAALSVTTLALAAVPTAAHAQTEDRAGRDFEVIGTYEGGQHQACKVLVNDGSTWRIFNRMVNKSKQEKIGAGMQILHRGKQTSRTWRSQLVARGATSAVGYVNLPKGKPGFTIEAFQFAAQSGTGKTVAIARIGRC